MDHPLYALIPISVFVMVTIVTCTSAWLVYRVRRDHYETIRYALELNQPLDPELMRLFKRSYVEPQLDFRDGLICLAIGTSLGAIAVLNALTGGADLSSRISGATGILVFGLGIGLIIASKVRLKVRESDTPSGRAS